MATGGGPPVIVEHIDPTVAQITPHIMVQVPGVVDSDMMANELDGKQRISIQHLI